MEERSRRIVETAVELAEQGGFANVRLRDVASHAGVALGTLYRRFRSKEDLLVAALEQETADLEQRVASRPPEGDTPLARVDSFFASTTRALCRRPNLTRAFLRAMTSGDPEVSERVASFHDRMTRLITLSLRGGGDGTPPSDRELRVADVLQQVWFAALVGWAADLRPQDEIATQVRKAAELLLESATDAAA